MYRTLVLLLFLFEYNTYLKKKNENMTAPSMIAQLFVFIYLAHLTCHYYHKSLCILLHRQPTEAREWKIRIMELDEKGQLDGRIMRTSMIIMDNSIDSKTTLYKVEIISLNPFFLLVVCRGRLDQASMQ